MEKKFCDLCGLGMSDGVVNADLPVGFFDDIIANEKENDAEFDVEEARKGAAEIDLSFRWLDESYDCCITCLVKLLLTVKSKAKAELC